MTITAVGCVLLPVGQEAAVLLPELAGEERERGEELGGEDGPAQTQQGQNHRHHPAGRGHVAGHA